MIAIIDYGMGNLHSVSKALNSLGYQTIITSKHNEIIEADKVILPGVGAFKDAIKALKDLKLDITIKEVVKNNKPLLGICLGMQLLFEKSYEFGEYEGLGILPGKIVRFDNDLIVPHMGWNNLIDYRGRLFKNIENPYVYFVHSYYLDSEEDFVSSYVDYGKRIAVSVEKNNIYATQFHPEKSGEIGLKILKNFGEL